MLDKTIQRLIGALIIVMLLAPFLLAQQPVSAQPPLLKNPCALDPNNLITNGSMSGERGNQWGSTADNWDAFVLEGSAHFTHVDNEQIDPNGSTQIVSTSTFDAGIFQTVRNLQPGMYYWFRLGYSLAAKSYSGPNVRVQSIGRKVGVDPFGGTDPKSPNVVWGPDLFDGTAALNRPEMEMIFAARSSNATIFLRAMAREGGSGENRVWFDAVCMEGRPDMPTATPAVPTATPTLAATLTPTPRPTNTRAPATRIAQAPATEVAPTDAPAPAPTVASTPTETPPPTATPRFARPVPTTMQESSMDLGAGAVIGIVGVLLVGAFVFFIVGIIWWRRAG